MNNNWLGKGILKSKHKVMVGDGKYEVTDATLSIKRLVNNEAKFCFVPLEAWGIMSQKLQDFEVGDYLLVGGRFENKNWRDKDGKELSKNVIVVETIEQIKF